MTYTTEQVRKAVSLFNASHMGHVLPDKLQKRVRRVVEELNDIFDEVVR